jgi:hypothetical protein
MAPSAKLGNRQLAICAAKTFKLTQNVTRDQQKLITVSVCNKLKINRNFQNLFFFFPEFSKPFISFSQRSVDFVHFISSSFYPQSTSLKA